MNELKTIILLGLLTAILVSIVYGIIGDETGLYIGLIVAAVINFSLWYYCDRLALSIYQAQPLNPQQKRTILPMVERLCQRADLPLPQVYIIPMSLPNAFATGRDPEHGIIALTEGIIHLLPSEELEGVIAHELSHIKHHDTLISTIAATLGNAIFLLADFLNSGFFFASKNNNFFNYVLRFITVFLAPITAIIIQLAISRAREYEADAGAAKITNNPRGLANALQRLENYCYHFSDDYYMAFSSLFIINPLSENSFYEIFSTHPPTEKRIRKLLNYEVNRSNFHQETMNNQTDNISEEQLQEILEEAARLYEKSQNNYSVEEVEEAAQEAGIPSDYFRQALENIEREKKHKKQKSKQIKKIIKNILVGSLIICIVITTWCIFAYNNLGNQLATVEGKWAQVENQFQRRADLIPTLIKVTETYSNHEKNLVELLATSRQLYLEAVTREEKYQGIEKINEAIAQFQDYVADNSRLNSNQLFINLQYEIIGTENRIAVERMRYNQSVQKYNQSLNQFPNVMIAKPLGFKAKAFYQFDEITIQPHP